MDNHKEKILRATILSMSGIGSHRLRQLIAFCGSAQKAWEAEKDSFPGLGNATWVTDFFRNKKQIDPMDVSLRLRNDEIHMVMLGEDHYPALLGECPDAPPLLFYKGVLESGKEGLAVVGSRRATPYGKAVASTLARSIADTQFVVVSGLARGIDAAAHRGALEGDGITWAFMAGGLDMIYPPDNVNLARLITQKGALISEYPPGVPAEAGQFPARNRLISGSSRGVIVVEAAQRSGALITADFALEQGREVFAVPGPIFSEQSKGTHQLLKMGAKLVGDPEDIFSELGGSYLITPQISIKGEERSSREDGGTINQNGYCLLELLSDTPLHIDQITASCALSPQEIALSLLELQLAGRIFQLPGQNYVLQR